MLHQPSTGQTVLRGPRVSWPVAGPAELVRSGLLRLPSAARTGTWTASLWKPSSSHAPYAGRTSGLAELLVPPFSCLDWLAAVSEVRRRNHPLGHRTQGNETDVVRTGPVSSVAPFGTELLLWNRGSREKREKREREREGDACRRADTHANTNARMNNTHTRTQNTHAQALDDMVDGCSVRDALGNKRG